MNFGEWLSMILVLLLALYGCAQLIRRLCLWAVRCPRTVRYYRVALPGADGAVEPLIRCLQAQAAWSEERARERTVILLPSDSAGYSVARRLAREDPAVTPVTLAELTSLLTEEMKRSL